MRKGGHYGANLDVSFSVRGVDGKFVPLAPSRRFAVEAVPFSKPPRCRGMRHNPPPARPPLAVTHAATQRSRFPPQLLRATL